MKTIEELQTKLKEKGIIEVKEEILKAAEKLIPLYTEETLINICIDLVTKYYDEHLSEVFGETRSVEGDKTITYTKEENTGTRSKGIRVKTDYVIGSTKTKKANTLIGTKATNARDPKLESVYKLRVAVYISHLREHAKWFLGAVYVEKLIKHYAEVYTETYNTTFGTNFALHYTKPKKDWETWYLAQQVAE